MASGFGCWRENISSGAVPKFVVFDDALQKAMVGICLKEPLRTGRDSLSPG